MLLNQSNLSFRDYSPIELSFSVSKSLKTQQNINRSRNSRIAALKTHRIRSASDFRAPGPHCPLATMHGRSRHRNSPRQFSLLLNVLLFTTTTTTVLAAFTNDFSGYPAGAQQCLYDASDSSGCNGDTVAEMNTCLCQTSGFAASSAQCVGRKDAGDLESTYEVMDLHCSESNTALSLSKDQWLAAGDSASTTTTTTSAVTTSAKTTDGQTVTATVTSTPTTTPGDGSTGGLSSGARIGVIAGASVVGAVLVAAAVFLIVRYRRRRNRRHEEEQHPMLPSSTQHFGAGGGPGAGDASAHPSHFSTAPSELESATAAWKYDPNKRDSGPVDGKWHSPQDEPQYPWSPGGFHAYSSPQQGNQHQPPPPVYELPADSGRPMSRASLPKLAPVEMPAISVTEPTPTSPGPQYGISP